MVRKNGRFVLLLPGDERSPCLRFFPPPIAMPPGRRTHARTHTHDGRASRHASHIQDRLDARGVLTGVRTRADGSGSPGGGGVDGSLQLPVHPTRRVQCGWVPRTSRGDCWHRVSRPAALPPCRTTTSSSRPYHHQRRSSFQGRVVAHKPQDASDSRPHFIDSSSAYRSIPQNVVCAPPFGPEGPGQCVEGYHGRILDGHEHRPVQQLCAEQAVLYGQRCEVCSESRHGRGQRVQLQQAEGPWYV